MSTSTSESNKQIVLTGYAALKAGDVASYFDSMTEDVTITTSAIIYSPAPTAAKRTSCRTTCLSCSSGSTARSRSP
ncbi:hypothetical protein [Nannocystis pusilla]|uniref:hypothetical protein n=1 Tax=Nannocystis pusilla TaxID=889268 RepID=UPI003B790C4C